jgi:hypothetical protein
MFMHYSFVHTHAHLSNVNMQIWCCCTTRQGIILYYNNLLIVAHNAKKAMGNLP